MTQPPPELHRVNPQDIDARCPEGKLIKSCELASHLLFYAFADRPDHVLSATDEMKHEKHLHYIGKKCADCVFSGIAILDMDGTDTLGIKLEFSLNDKNTLSA